MNNEEDETWDEIRMPHADDRLENPSNQRLHYQLTMESMHENTFIEIAQYLSYKDIGRCLLICRSWNQLIEQSRTLWKYMYQNMHFNHCAELLTDPFDSHIHAYRNRHFTNDLLKNQFYIDWNSFYSPERRISGTSLRVDGRSWDWKECFLQTQFFVQRYFHPIIPPAVTLNPTTLINTITNGENDGNNDNIVVLTAPNTLALPPPIPVPTALPTPNEIQPESGLLHAQFISVTPIHAHVPRGGHNCHVLKTATEDLLILLSGDIPVDYGEFPTADVISLKTGELLYSNMMLLPNNMTSTWLNCSVKVNNKIYLVQHDEVRTTVLKISLGKRRILESKLLQEEAYPLAVSSITSPTSSSSTSPADLLAANKPQHPQRGSSFILDPRPITQSSSSLSSATSYSYSSPSGKPTSSVPSSSSVSHQQYRCVLFGGEIDEVDNVANERFVNDVYLLIIDESRPEVIQWQKIRTTGERPCPRAAHSAILVGRNMYIFGGWTSPTMIASTANQSRSTSVFDDVFLNDLYVLNIDVFHWTKVETLGIPPVPRCQSVLIGMPAYSRSSSRSSASTSSARVNFSKNSFGRLFPCR